jgi:phosphoribosylanthranilate isomerase
MINGITLKVCGITSLNDAVAASGIGADYLGFIFHPDSPRYVSESRFQRMAGQLPFVRRVAVCVDPSPEDLTRLAGLKFDAFQVHCAHTTSRERMEAWANAAGAGRLWLAPRLPPEDQLADDWLPVADTFLLDTYHPDKAGGTGRTGDWGKFRRHMRAHPMKTWILAGGLHPDNVVAALDASGALFLDVNSGVESAPGVKSQERLFALWKALEGA